MQMIMAADRNWGIGNDGKLLVHLAGDMKFFREKTTGGTVVMGRGTLESLPGSRGLPNRRNLVLTTRQDYRAERAEIVHSIEDLLALLAADGTDLDSVFVIGGAGVYEELLPYCTVCWITKIDAAFPADRHFRDLDRDPDFRAAWESGKKEENGISYRFMKYERS